MQEIDDNIENKTNHVTTDNRYVFDFEQVNWSSKPTNHKISMTQNALNHIENERVNIEKDLKLLQAIKDERSRLENLMFSFIQIKNELEKKLETSL